MKKMKPFLDNFELHFMVILMGIFIINVTAQIVMRSLFNYPLFFAEEVSRVAFLWMVFLGLSYATLHDRHIRINFIVAFLPKTVQRCIEIFIHLLAIVLFCWILYTSFGFLKFSANTVTPALRVSKAIFAAILPLASFLTIVRSAQKIAMVVAAMRERSPQP